MKLIYTDFFCHAGHEEFNKIYLRELRNENLLVVFKKGYLSNFTTENNISRIDVPKFLFFVTKSNPLINRMISFFLVLIVGLVFFRNKKRTKIVAAYDEIILGLHFWFPKSYLINHNNIDGLENKLKFFFFSSLSKKHIQIVFNNYISNYLIHKGVVGHKILPHGLPKKITKYKKCYIEKFIFIPSQSNSNNKLFLEIINYPKLLVFVIY